MSFQGDVAGIGLAELLQSIARGRREGVLTLTGRNGIRSHVGLQGGILYLLPAPEEDPIIWKERARQAWVHDPDFRVDAMRMAEIARAHRIERLYKLLDCVGVHFRFEPGPLPDRPVDADADAAEPEPGARRLPAVHCDGLAVEFMLLEYARISDEAEGLHDLLDFSDHGVPRPLDADSAPKEHQAFYRQCDGSSSLQEIADRLAWPIRQVRLVVAGELHRGHLRLAAARELLVLAQRELAQGHLSRAASRLSAWVQTSQPGPCSEEDALLLEAEWKAERMGALLNLMPTREARALLRRMDHALDDPRITLRHWRELGRLHRHCPITLLHRIAAEHRSEDDQDAPALRELLDTARGLRESRHPRRAAALLRIAAAYVPATTSSQLELGMGMIAADLVEEGGPWILEAVSTMIAERSYEKAIPPLRALLTASPGHREARALLTRARSLAVRRNIIRKHSLVALALLLAMSVGAYVQVRMDRDAERKLTEIANLMGQPAQARALLEEYFGDSEAVRVKALRAAIDERQRSTEEFLRSGWYERYKNAQSECTLGDPLLGLRRAMELEQPPELLTIEEPWPLVVDLFNGLAARFEKAAHDLGPPSIDDDRQEHAERILSEAIDRQRTQLAEASSHHDTSGYEQRLVAVAMEVEQRAQVRADKVAERDRLDKVNTQDMMLAAARSHGHAGDLTRSLDVYRRLLESDTSGKLERILAREIAEIEARHGLEGRARDLAEAGRHAEALELLENRPGGPLSIPLPWKLDTYPAGAEVRFPDGLLHHTPLVHELRPGDRLSLTITSPGCEPVTLAVDGPGDREVWLSRTPDRSWRPDGRVEALPVAVSREHLVADRTGRLARLDEAGGVAWERELGTLGGVARAPVFLPSKPGHVLILTEDGEAWMLEARNGSLEGPYRLGSQPVDGPTVTQGAVVARLADGRVLRWEQRLQPSEESLVADSSTFDSESRYGSSAGLAVLRRAQGGDPVLVSPWTDVRVEVTREVFRVTRRDSGRELFFVRRKGDWTYLAWEAPHALLPAGRLWISDGAGLRAFVPR